MPEELHEDLVSVEWVEERKLRWGIGSPIYTSKVDGEFPEISDDTLIMPSWIEAAQARHMIRNHRPRPSVDVARFGTSETVIMRREEGWARVHRAHTKTATTETTGHVVRALDDIGREPDLNDWPDVIVDEDGVGGGVVDQLREQDKPVTGV